MIRSLVGRGIADEARSIGAHNVAEKVLESLWEMVNRPAYIPNTRLESLAAVASTATAFNGKPLRLLAFPIQLIDC